MSKMEDIVKRNSAVQATYGGIAQLHMAATLRGDAKEEGELRQRLHASLDALLDIQIEMIHEIELGREG